MTALLIVFGLALLAVFGGLVALGRARRRSDTEAMHAATWPLMQLRMRQEEELRGLLEQVAQRHPPVEGRRAVFPVTFSVGES